MVQASIFSNITVLVRGGGDLGSGVAYRLHKSGFPVIVSELAKPLFVRRGVAYGAAVYEQVIQVDGITARLTSLSETKRVQEQGEVPVVVEPGQTVIAALHPLVIVDARMAKAPLDTDIHHAPLVIALGPGFETGTHCHAVIETNRGHTLGRVFWNGHAEPDTGTPGTVGGVSNRRVLRSPAEGRMHARKQIGDLVDAGDIVAEVDRHPVVTQIGGIIRGLIHPSVDVWRGLKVGDIDPRAKREHCFTISEKALAIGGGVVEAILSADLIREQLRG